jgi:hypothetical protein
MTEREQMRLLAYGQYAFSHRNESIEVKDMETFVEGCLWAFDYTQKKTVDIKYVNAMQLGTQIDEQLDYMPIDTTEMV